MSMEIGGVGVRVVTDFTAVRVAFLRAIRADTNGRIGVAAAGPGGAGGAG